MKDRAEIKIVNLPLYSGRSARGEVMRASTLIGSASQKEISSVAGKVVLAEFDEQQNLLRFLFLAAMMWHSGLEGVIIVCTEEIIKELRGRIKFPFAIAFLREGEATQLNEGDLVQIGPAKFSYNDLDEIDQRI